MRVWVLIGDYIVRKDMIVLAERSVDNQAVLLSLADGTCFAVEDVDGSVWNFLGVLLVERSMEDFLSGGLYS